LSHYDCNKHAATEVTVQMKTGGTDGYYAELILNIHATFSDAAGTFESGPAVVRFSPN
jgi:hypothetical protein